MYLLMEIVCQVYSQCLSSLLLCSLFLRLQDATVIPHLMALLSRSRYTQEYICQIFSHCCKVRTRINVLCNVKSAMPSGDVPSLCILPEITCTYIIMKTYVYSILFPPLFLYISKPIYIHPLPLFGHEWQHSIHTVSVPCIFHLTYLESYSISVSKEPPSIFFNSHIVFYNIDLQ